MNRFYHNTFDQVRMSQDSAQRMRADLAAQCARKETETTTMRKRQWGKRPAVLLTAALLAGALSVTALAYGGEIAQAVHALISGGTVETGVDENGNAYTSVAVGFEAAPVELRDDRLFFVADGQNIDITDRCSNESPYYYEFEDGENLRHVLVVGGTPGAMGYAEFLWDETGMPLAGSSSFDHGVDPNNVPWLDAAKASLNLPW